MTEEEIKKLKRLNKTPYSYWSMEEAELVATLIREVGWKETEHEKITCISGHLWCIGFINPKTKRILLIDRALKKLLE
jgi:hypothetical protein